MFLVWLRLRRRFPYKLNIGNIVKLHYAKQNCDVHIISFTNYSWHFYFYEHFYFNNDFDDFSDFDFVNPRFSYFAQLIIWSMIILSSVHYFHLRPSILRYYAFILRLSHSIVNFFLSNFVLVNFVAI